MRGVYLIKMLAGVNFLKKYFLFLLIVFMISPLPAVAQNLEYPRLEDKKGIYTILKDERGEIIEGFLRSGIEEVLVQTKDNREQLIPLKYIKSISLEKTKSLIPGGEAIEKAHYVVRLENSQEIYTLKNKYTFSLVTNLGLVTKTIDPETINKILFKENSAGQIDNEKPFIQEKSIVFSLEFKF